MRIVVLLATAALVLVGCGSEGGVSGEGDMADRQRGTVGDGDGDGDGPTELRIVVRTGPGDRGRTYSLSCDPPGGDHPDPEGACLALGRLKAPFAPVPKGTACTDIYGGPQTARVTGTFRGEPVDAEFSRTDGCQIGRWDAHVALLVERGGADGS